MPLVSGAAAGLGSGPSLAPFAPLTAEDQDLPVPLWLCDVLFASEVPYWLLSRVAPRALWPDAQLITFESGGQLLIGHMAEARAAVGAHLRARAE